MNYKSLFTVAFAALCLAACDKNEEEVNTGTPSVPTGEKTVAYINFALADSRNFRGSSQEGTGQENALINENKLQTANIYIFKKESETRGYPEDMKEGLPFSAEHPGTPIQLESGEKHIVVVVNPTGNITTTLRNKFGTGGTSTETYSAFIKATEQMGAWTSNTDDDFNVNKLMLETGDGISATKPALFMSGETDKVLMAGITESEAKQETSPNHIKVYVDRALAKVDVKMTEGANQYAQTKPVSTVGKISNMTYDIRNQKREVFLRKQQGGMVDQADYLVTTPWWNFGGNNDATHEDYKDKFFPYTPDGDNFAKANLDKKILSSANDATSDNYRDFVSYVTETTSQSAYKGTSAYAALKASYMPETDFLVSGVANSGTNNKLELQKNGTINDNQYSLFNYEYNLAFSSKGTPAEATNEANFKALAAWHVAQIEPALADISTAKIRLACVTGATIPGIGDMLDHDLIGLNVAEDINSTANQNIIAAATNTPTVWIKIEKKANANSDFQQYIVTGAYYYEPVTGKGYIRNTGVVFDKLVCGNYQTTGNGLTCYYRQFIMDNTYKHADTNISTSPMLYSVVRNYSYHIDITKINSIGYPTEGDLAVEPEQPINANTFIQAHVYVNKWLKKDINSELDRN